MNLKTALWGRQLAQNFFEHGGFEQPKAVLLFKEKFLTLLENSPLETKDFRQDLDLIALGSLALIEAGANDCEIDLLLSFIGRLEEKPFETPPHWFTKFLIELIKIKHAYTRHTAWFAADPLDSVVADCVKQTFLQSIDIADESRFLEDLNNRNLERFGYATDLASLNGLKEFLQILRDDGSGTASYLLLLLRLEQPDLPTIIETLGSLSDDLTPISQLATFHLASVLETYDCYEDAARGFQSVLYEFEPEDYGTTIPDTYAGLTQHAENALERFALDKRFQAGNSRNIDELVEDQIYRVEHCVSELKDVAQFESPIMLPARLSSLAVETGKLAEAFWRCCLVIHRKRSPPVKRIVMDAAQTGGANARQQNAALALSIQAILGNKVESGEGFRDHLLGLLEAWQHPSVYVIDFLQGKHRRTTRLAIAEALFVSEASPLRETKADYPTLVLANIFAAAFNASHPLATLETAKGKDLINVSRKAFQLRNDHAHYLAHSEPNFRFQLHIVLRSSEALINQIKVLGKIA